MYELEKANVAQQGFSSGTKGYQDSAAPVQETLASITPRVLALARKVADRSDHIACSLGLVPRTGAENQAVDKIPSLTLLTALCEIEKALDFAYGRLESVGTHING